MAMEFGRNFFWGAATSAHQVEGNNTNNDWWAWENASGGRVRSLAACRHYDLYKEDFDLARELGHNCHRLSLEWSRVEPEPGKFSEEEIAHYRGVLDALKERGIEPVVTLHHFTSPVWFMQMGGWLNQKARHYFLHFAEKMANEFAKDVKFWVTINEPTIYAYYGYLVGDWPPQERSLLKAKAVLDNLSATHIRAYRLIHDIYKRNDLAAPMVSISANLQAFEYCRPTLANKLAVYLRNKFFNLYFIDRLVARRSLDYIGLNYYGRSLVDVRKAGITHLFMDVCQDNHLPLKKNSLGWDIYPLGLYKLLMQLKKYKLPVLITENGICTEDDSLRWEYIQGHLQETLRAAADGANVIGYIYWSLLDNFEWDKGFGPRFGLVHVDYNDYKRTIRESARRLADVCKTGRIPL
ncbi:MAG: glycoside hydrolase family 1 protein [Candidatus Omnitrophota bacterium]|jgi:beta-glucosidase